MKIIDGRENTGYAYNMSGERLEGRPLPTGDGMRVGVSDEMVGWR